MIPVIHFGLASLAAISAVAFAQPGEEPSAAASARASDALKYESAFSGYKPFREQELQSWKEANRVVAENPMRHEAGAMKGARGSASSPGHDMGAMKDSLGKAGGSGHDMSTMKGASGNASSPRHDMSAMKGASGEAARPGHDMGTMKEPVRKSTVAMVDQRAAAGRMPSSPVTGTGIVQAIDKANARVKLTHDPIAALGWPKLTLFFRLKDRSLAEQVKEGERVEFSLENSASGFVISEFHAAPAKPDAK